MQGQKNIKLDRELKIYTYNAFNYKGGKETWILNVLCLWFFIAFGTKCNKQIINILTTCIHIHKTHVKKTPLDINFTHFWNKKTDFTLKTYCKNYVSIFHNNKKTFIS
jgi:hypothetical protein